MLVDSTVEGRRVNMKQKLFLPILLVGFLITAPTLADPVIPTPATNPSDFGAVVPGGMATDTVTALDSSFSLTLDAEVRYAGGIYTYIYTLTLTAGNPPPSVSLGSLTILNGLFDFTSLQWGYFGASDPFSLPVTTSPFLVFHFSSFTATPGPSIVVIYGQSLLPPTVSTTEYFFGDGTALGTTLGPTDAGGGASFGVPEPSSLLLLTFGLLSGGVLRFRINRPRG